MEQAQKKQFVHLPSPTAPLRARTAVGMTFLAEMIFRFSLIERDGIIARFWKRTNVCKTLASDSSSADHTPAGYTGAEPDFATEDGCNAHAAWRAVAACCYEQ